MKRIISILIILVLFLLPFSILLNVNAVQISVDNNTTNGQGKKVLNESADGVVVHDIGENDQMALYKVLDVYYDSGTNQMSYGLASNFYNFARIQNPEITINSYLNATTSSGGQPYYDNSDFNEIVSKYAIYIRANNIAYDYQMTTAYDASIDEYYAHVEDVVAGAYLVLPTSVSTRMVEEGIFPIMEPFAYSVMMANVTASIDQNNDWVFEQVEINAKHNISQALTLLVEDEATNIMGIATGLTDFGMNMEYDPTQSYSFYILSQTTYPPSNAHESIKQLYSGTAVRLIDITYPSSMIPDLTEVYAYEGTQKRNGRIENGKYYVENLQDQSVEVADVVVSNQTIYIDSYYSFSMVVNIDIDADALSTTSAGNTISISTYALKDPYVDIGTVTYADIRNAFITTDPDYNSTKSVNIRKAIQKVDQTVSLYTTGLSITNKNDNNSPLTGAEFAIFEYNDQTNSYSTQVGSNIVINSNPTLINGIQQDKTYQLRQVKAPNGYRLYNDKIIVLRPSNDQTNYDPDTYMVIDMTNGLYTVTVNNHSILPLPITGGIGTIIYTAVGLLVIVGSVIFIIAYKKKKKEVVVEEL